MNHDLGIDIAELPSDRGIRGHGHGGIPEIHHATHRIAHVGRLLILILLILMQGR